jgi:pilus assembly protein CpaB
MNLRAIVISAIVGVLTVLLLTLYLRRLEVETSGGGPVQVLTAVKALEPGTVITSEMVTVKAVPQAYVESRAVRKNDAARIVGLKVETPVKAQQTLMWTDLAVTSDERRTLSGFVQPGMRAVVVRGGDGDRYTLVRPGDRVDVFASLPKPKDDQARVEVLVVQNVLVLAVGSDIGSREAAAHPSSDRNDNVLTLSVNPQQLQAVALAMESGKITVGLRHYDDTRPLERLQDLDGPSLLQVDDKPRPAALPTKPINVTAKPKLYE